MHYVLLYNFSLICFHQCNTSFKYFCTAISALSSLLSYLKLTNVYTYIPNILCIRKYSYYDTYS